MPFKKNAGLLKIPRIAAFNALFVAARGSYIKPPGDFFDEKTFYRSFKHGDVLCFGFRYFCRLRHGNDCSAKIYNIVLR